jgi:hypothetical protein
MPKFKRVMAKFDLVIVPARKRLEQIKVQEG